MSLFESLFGSVEVDEAARQKQIKERLEKVQRQAKDNRHKLSQPLRPEKFWKSDDRTSYFKESFSYAGKDGKESRYLVNTPNGNVRANSYQTLLDIYKRKKEEQRQDK